MSSVKLVVLFDRDCELNINAIHERVGQFYDVGYVGLYDCGDDQAVYIQGLNKKIRMAPGKMRKQCESFGTIRDVKRYEKREGALIDEAGCFRKPGRKTKTSTQGGGNTVSASNKPKKRATKISTINLLTNAFGHEDISHITVDQFKEVTERTVESPQFRDGHLLHGMARLIYDNPHNCNIVAGKKSGYFKYFGESRWVLTGTERLYQVVENWKQKTLETVRMLEERSGEDLAFRGFGNEKIITYFYHIRDTAKHVKRRTLSSLYDLDAMVKGVESATGKRIRRVSGREYGLRDVVSRATWQSLGRG